MRDKNELPVDLIYELLVSRNLYGCARKNFAKRFGLVERKDDAEIYRKTQEFKKEIEENKEKYLIRLAKSARLVSKYIDHFHGSRLPKQAEELFFEKFKDSSEYYHYCSKFGIIVDNYNQILTEVAMECEKSNDEAFYLESILDKRKDCKKFIEEFVKFNEINKNDSIESLLSML